MEIIQNKIDILDILKCKNYFYLLFILYYKEIMHKIVILAQFILNNNEIEDLMIILSVDKIYKQMKIMKSHNIH